MEYAQGYHHSGEYSIRHCWPSKTLCSFGDKLVSKVVDTSINLGAAMEFRKSFLLTSNCIYVDEMHCLN